DLGLVARRSDESLELTDESSPSGAVDAPRGETCVGPGQDALCIPGARDDTLGAHDGEFQVAGAAGPLTATDLAHGRGAAREAELHDQVVVDLQRFARGMLPDREHARRRLADPPASEVYEVHTVVQRVAAGQLGVQHPCL